MDRYSGQVESDFQPTDTKPQFRYKSGISGNLSFEHVNEVTWKLTNGAAPPMTTINPFIKQILMTAGPTPVPPRVLSVMAEPVLYHRAPAGVELYTRVLERLPRRLPHRNTVLAFAASGSGAMDSAVANLVRPGTKALACAAGKFGERWIELCEAYGPI